MVAKYLFGGGELPLLGLRSTPTPQPGWPVVHRIEDFDSGDVACRECGRTLHLFWNGGELDAVECCGRTYRTEHVRVDLVVYQQPPEVAAKAPPRPGPGDGPTLPVVSGPPGQVTGYISPDGETSFVRPPDPT